MTWSLPRTRKRRHKHAHTHTHLYLLLTTGHDDSTHPTMAIKSEHASHSTGATRQLASHRAFTQGPQDSYSGGAQGPKGTPGRRSPRPSFLDSPRPPQIKQGRGTDQSTHASLGGCDWSMAVLARGEHATIFSMMLGQLAGLVPHGGPPLPCHLVRVRFVPPCP